MASQPHEWLHRALGTGTTLDMLYPLDQRYGAWWQDEFLRDVVRTMLDIDPDKRSEPYALRQRICSRQGNLKLVPWPTRACDEQQLLPGNAELLLPAGLV